MSLQEQGLKRSVKSRQLMMIAFGSSIGTGLFLGSASSIQYAGPAVLISFAIVGVIVYFLMRMLGEMAVEHPVSGSFAAYSREFIGRGAGFITGWNWWFTTVVVGMLELTAMGTFLDYWFPHIPHWVTALVSLLLVVVLNVLNVRVFATTEYWLSLIKVAALVLMIVLGLALVFGVGSEPAIGLQHITDHGGFMPNGISGVLFALVAVTFTFGGIMSIGTAAGEADDPDKAIPRAVNSVVWRILVFYLGGIGTILLLAPWNEQDTNESPFIRVLTGVGFSGAATALNVVIVVAVFSVLNTMTYSGARMLRDLARHGQAPKALAETNRKGLPTKALLFDATLMGVVVILNYFFEGKIFAILLAIIVGTELITWAGICLSHLNFRKHAGNTKFPAPFYPVANWICIAFFALVLVLMGILPDYRMGLTTLFGWILALGLIWLTTQRRSNA
ncbi:amino acid permease [uncultured Corynebacterium sp.]|mgnify:FL=1|uniref:amino acid permease n=1 Tax=uncultured Corynebacterium sp. TaxID=159447 RepID=UPI002598D1F6|nr:amino acid permease [uncultured Corynebacterium sp.]